MYADLELVDKPMVLYRHHGAASTCKYFRLLRHPPEQSELFREARQTHLAPPGSMFFESHAPLRTDRLFVLASVSVIL